MQQEGCPMFFEIKCLTNDMHKLKKQTNNPAVHHLIQGDGDIDNGSPSGGIQHGEVINGPTSFK